MATPRVGCLFAVIACHLGHAHAYAHATRPSLPLNCRRATPPWSAAKQDDGRLEKNRAIDRQFVAIALPALVQFAAEPLAGLVDTAYLGRLGASALGGAGVAISAHYATAKLFNDPLLRTSISIVAQGDGAASRQQASGDAEPSSARDEAISAALVLALAAGLLQTAFFLVAAPSLVGGMGAGAGSSMRPIAISYLRVRALGMPAATMWLVANGIFRGLGDTRTPLLWALLFSGLNAVLDPIFIFPLGLGAAGAAAGTALSQSIALAGLLRVLQQRTGVAVSPLALLSPTNLRTLGPALAAYGQAGVLVFFRTWGKVIAYTYCSRRATELGAVASAAHLLCFNLGVLLSQLCESVAVATQTLLARAMGALRAAAAVAVDEQALTPESKSAKAAAREARADAWHVIKLGSLVGGTIAALLTGLTAFRPATVIAGLTTDGAVRAACGAIIGPVLCCQLFKGLAFPSNGVIMGGLDWSFASVEIWAGSLLCIALVHARSPPTLVTIWIGLAAFMGAQTLMSVARVASRTGPWAVLFDDT